MTFSPLDCSGLMTWPQLEPSAHAPWASTTLAVVSDPLISFRICLRSVAIGWPASRIGQRLVSCTSIAVRVQPTMLRSTRTYNPSNVMARSVDDDGWAHTLVLVQPHPWMIRHGLGYRPSR